MSIVPPNSWTSWQSVNMRGPTRWSSDHYTADGNRTLCGIYIPKVNVFQRGKGETGNTCPGCQRKIVESAKL